MLPFQPLKVSRYGIAFLFFLPLITQAQLPEQDCSGAIVVTSSPDTFPVYSTYGLIDELTYEQNTSCLVGGEENSVWITFTACDTGLLLFQISPYAASDDFDWALYDFTNHTCADVLDLLNEVRCNYSALAGPTGLAIGYMMTSVPAGGPNQCSPLHPYANQRFLLIVNNHAQSNSGFILAFSGTVTLCSSVGVRVIIRDRCCFLYPNPTDGILQLKDLPAQNNLSIQVLNLYGNKVYGKELKGFTDNQINLPALLPNGFYVMRILEEEKLFGEEGFIISR